MMVLIVAKVELLVMTQSDEMINTFQNTHFQEHHDLLLQRKSLKHFL